ncbi:MAG: hypothetical protein A3A86_07500 [Elusimicrobia bacterium RIFCSPLOWO2_01_FULL_60_11]|nr:MAG: hypothetical protein A3A86_07500 [Elusimicrobia bacterium RIFCSPLOWO2_01_FULL_60_11]
MTPRFVSILPKREKNSSRKLSALLTALFLLNAPIPLSAAAPGRVIGSIIFDIHSVFDTDSPEESGWVYRAADSIHVKTREAVIRRELLFSEGGPYVPALVKETERNLRRLGFIRRAKIETAVNSKGTVDVTVHTYDSWTLEVVADAGRAGGTNRWKAGFSESNLMGMGKTASAKYINDGADSQADLGWKDPQVMGLKHLNSSVKILESPDTRSYSAAVNRPFFASIARSALGVTAGYGENKVTTYSGETVTNTVRKRTRDAGVNYGLALKPSTHRARRVNASFNQHRADYSATRETSGPVPESEQLGFFQLGLDWEVLDFVKVRRIQKFSHDEDYNLGFGIFPGVSWAPPVYPLSSTGSSFLPGFLIRKGFSWTERLLMMKGGYTNTYVNAGESSSLLSMDALFFITGLPRQTLALHTAYDHGSRLGPAASLGLGENNGLRGYGENQFTGSRRFLLNVEDRIFIREDVFKVLDIGAVAFYDAGYAWPAERRTRLNDIKSSVGFGLRLAPSRSSGNSPTRIDFAYPLNGTAERSGWSVSILGGHAFGPS